MTFSGNSTAGNAALTANANTLIDFTPTTGLNGDNKISAGSIKGAGLYLLGANELTVGSNNLSTEVSGVIGGSGGSLVKIGTGTLTLSGTNTYTGGTTFAGGTVSVSSDANLGDLAGSLTFKGGILQVTGTAFNTTARTINLGSGGGTFDIADAANNFILSQDLGGTTLTKTGAGTLTLTGTESFYGAMVSAGTLAFLDTTAGNADEAGRRPRRPARLPRRRPQPRRQRLPDEHRQHPRRPAVPRLVGAVRPRQRQRQPARLRRAARLPRRPARRQPQLGHRLHAGHLPGHALPRRQDARSAPRPAADRGASAPSSAAKLDFIQELNRRHRATRSEDDDLEARIASYELAFRMQSAAPEAVDLAKETDARRNASTASTTRRRSASAATACWPAGWSSAACASCSSTAARGSKWDAHGNVEGNHASYCRESDRPDRGPAART